MRLKKLLLWLSISCAVLALLCGGCIYFVADAPPPEDAGFRIESRDVPEVENGYHALDLRHDDIHWPRDDHPEIESMVFGDEWNPELAAEVLEKNELPLSRFDKCLKRREFIAPRLQSFDELGSSELMALRGVTNPVRLRLYVLYKEGREKEAFDETMKLVRFGHRIQGAQGTLVQYMIGAAIKRDGLDLLGKLIDRTRLGADELATHALELKKCGAHRQGLIDALKEEYQLGSQWCDSLAHGDVEFGSGWSWFSGLLTSRPFFNPNRTKRMIFDHYRSLVEALETNRPTAPSASWNPWIPSRNPLGRYLVQAHAADHYSLDRLHQDERLVLETRLALALKRFRSARGKPPAALDELVPEYLDEVPRDPRDGQPLPYDPRAQTP